MGDTKETQEGRIALNITELSDEDFQSIMDAEIPVEEKTKGEK